MNGDVEREYNRLVDKFDALCLFNHLEDAFENLLNGRPIDWPNDERPAPKRRRWWP